MSDNDLPKPDLVLRAKRGVRKYGKRSDSGKRVSPQVTLSFPPSDGHFDHPTLTVRWGSRYSNDDVDLVFQCHAVAYDDSSWGTGVPTRTRSRGFLKKTAARSSAYACTLSGKVDYDAHTIRWTLDLIEAAKKAAHAAFWDHDRCEPRPGNKGIAKADDEILVLVAGLQRIGIEIRVFNRALRERIANHRADRAQREAA